MNCNCISDIERRVKEHVIKNGKMKKPVNDVRMQGVVIGVTDGNDMYTRTANTMEITLEGQKKKETMSMFHSYCPFCGVKYEEVK